MIITDKAQIKATSLKESDKLHLTTSDELECYELIESDLKLPADATFTRSSPAYLSDGTKVTANTPRFEQGKFGKAIIVEEGATNLLQNPSFETDSNSDGLADNWTITIRGTGDSSRTHAVSRVQALLHGSYAQRLEITGGVTNTNGSGLQSASVNVTPGQVYTASAYVRVSVADKVMMSLRWVDSTGAYITDTYSQQKVGTSVTRITVTGTAPANAVRVSVMIYGINQVGEWLEVDAVQFEQKPYATSFIDGTRSPEYLTIPTAGALNPQEGTVEFWVYPFNTVKTLNYDRLLFSSSPALPGVFWCNIRPNQQLRFVYDSNGINVELTGGTVPNLSWSRITIRWNTSGVACFINGVLAASDPRPITAISGAVLRIGSDNTQYHANILIDDLRISNRARSDEEILEVYQSNKPLPVDEWTTYKLDFDDKVRITTQGQIICNELIEI